MAEVLDRQLSLFAWEHKALDEGRLKRLLRPSTSGEVHDRDDIVYVYGVHRLRLVKWRCHFAQIGGEEVTPNEPLTLRQVQEAGLADERAFGEWKGKFSPLPILETPIGSREVCWLATIEPE